MFDNDSIAEGKMQDRDLFSGFIKLHILHHAAHEEIFGAGMIDELSTHGYKLSPGTLYPMLHKMEVNGYLISEKREVNGKVRKYYRCTEDGQRALSLAREKARELFGELLEP